MNDFPSSRLSGRTLRIELSQAGVAWIAGLCLLTADNASFWRTLWASRDLGTFRSVLALAVLGILLLIAFSLIVRVLCWPRLEKIAVPAVLLIGACAAHYIDTYGILIDKSMVRNILQTDWREAADLLSPRFALDISLRGILPAAMLVLLVEVRHAPWRRSLVRIGWHALLLGVLAAASITAFFGEYADIARNHRELRHLLTPTNVANGAYGLWKESRAQRLPVTRLAEDATRTIPPASAKPLVVVLLVGETARAASFSLGGYERPTNAALAGKDLVYFDSVTSCGTDTATSLPCMFSDLGEKNFSVAKASERENVLDLLQRTGVGVTWVENNSGCKGVCDRLETEDLSAAGATGFCASGECLDAIFVDVLRQRLPKANSDSLLVLHMRGSHGPAYFRRAPSARPFEPICATTVIQSCAKEALRNTYDNSIAYTSEVLAQAIDVLAADNTRDTVLLYVSDHGESLGERGIYLHGLPKLMAPAEQTRIPLLLWMSAGASKRLGVDMVKLRERASRPASHDNLFPSLLGLFDVRAENYDRTADLLGDARDRGPVLARPR